MGSFISCKKDSQEENIDILNFSSKLLKKEMLQQARESHSLVSTPLSTQTVVWTSPRVK